MMAGERVGWPDPLAPQCNAGTVPWCVRVAQAWLPVR
jgi:hypothetical protein